MTSCECKSASSAEVCKDRKAVPLHASTTMQRTATANDDNGRPGGRADQQATSRRVANGSTIPTRQTLHRSTRDRQGQVRDMLLATTRKPTTRLAGVDEENSGPGDDNGQRAGDDGGPGLATTTDRGPGDEHGPRARRRSWTAMDRGPGDENGPRARRRLRCSSVRCNGRPAVVLSDRIEGVPRASCSTSEDITPRTPGPYSTCVEIVPVFRLREWITPTQ